jgi:branched-subunit amino acid permease
MGLWNSVPATLIVEFALFGVGAWVYAHSARARDALGNVLFWAFVIVLALLYVASVFGPPPPSEQALAVTGLLGWLFVAWGYWIDRHQVPEVAV